MAQLISPYFDYVVPEDPSLRGFIHKLHLDRYSPFDETFFFDSDVFVFRPLIEVIDHWRRQPYTACGEYISSGISFAGLDRVRVMRVLDRQRLVYIDGAGHAFFRKPDCHRVFDLAREVAADYPKYAGRSIKIADEDIIDIVMTILDLKPIPHVEFWARYLSGKPGTIQMDVTKGQCSMVLVSSGEIQRPYMVHFAANEAPFIYALQLKALYQKFGVSTRGIFTRAIRDFYVTKINWPFRSAVKSLMGRSK